MHNAANYTMIGVISEPCDAFSIIAGGGNYLLNPGESRQVTIRFSPTTVGAYQCTLDLQNCQQYGVTGYGYVDVGVPGLSRTGIVLLVFTLAGLGGALMRRRTAR